MNSIKKNRPLFIITRINYDHRDSSLNSKYSLPVTKEHNQKWRKLFKTGKAGGNGFHEGMNFLSYNRRVYVYLKPSVNRPSQKSITRRGAENGGGVCIISVAKNPDTSRDVIVGIQANLNLLKNENIRPDLFKYKSADRIRYHAEGEARYSILTGDGIETTQASSRGYKYLSVKEASFLFSQIMSSNRFRLDSKNYLKLKKVYKYCFGTSYNMKINSNKKFERKVSSSPTAGEDFEYLSKKKVIKVSARHRLVQGKFLAFLIRNKYLSLNENYQGVDIAAKKNGKVCFFEVKPTRKVSDCPEAIRYAIGQLFDYKHRINRRAKLYVVLGCEPSNHYKRLLKHLNIGLFYFTAKTFKEMKDV